MNTAKKIMIRILILYIVLINLYALYFITGRIMYSND
jgi:hypothetical protein